LGDLTAGLPGISQIWMNGMARSCFCLNQYTNAGPSSPVLRETFKAFLISAAILTYTASKAGPAPAGRLLKPISDRFCVAKPAAEKFL
jgi:hypothetical protein